VWPQALWCRRLRRPPARVASCLGAAGRAIHNEEISLNTSKLDGHPLGKTGDGHHEAEPVDPTEPGDHNFDTAVATVATVAVVGVGVLAFEAALLPGLALDVVTMLVPKFLPKIGPALSPVVKSTVRSAYKVGQKTREMVAEAEEHVHDIVAEVNAEDEAKAAAAETTRLRAANASAA
jgi:Protein of unknown function (DUF5132)